MRLRSVVCAVGGTLAFAVLVQAPASATPTPFSQIIAFGDSLTDTGNLFALTTAALGLGNALPQADDYWQGRFSNGPAAIETLKDGLGIDLQNYAIGGATTGTAGQFPDTGMQLQVAAFASSLSGPADPNALYFVWGGANDLRDLAPADIPAAIGTAVSNLSGMVNSLYLLGARNFMLPNMPDLGKIPEAISAGPATMAGATFASELFNQQLTGAFDSLALTLVGEHFTFVDIMSAQRALIAGAPANGFNNVSEGCFSGYVGEPGTKCADASGYVYWDRAHPSAATQAVLGAQMLAAVPEPQTVLMMAMGVVALLGLQARRARAVRRD